MIARALLVLLLVLNVGVATWWATRTPPTAAPPMQPPRGVAWLQLVDQTPGEVAPVTTPAVASQPAAAASPAAAVAGATTAAQCFSFGPYTSDQAAAAAQVRLQPLTQRIVLRGQGRGAARGWRVMLPALASPEEAAATVQRIAAAGIDDYFLVREGSEANSIALGRYGNETAARRRVDALVAAGFPARAEALGATTLWLDVSAAPGFDAPTAQRLAAAPERRVIDCAALP